MVFVDMVPLLVTWRGRLLWNDVLPCTPTHIHSHLFFIRPPFWEVLKLGLVPKKVIFGIIELARLSQRDHVTYIHTGTLSYMSERLHPYVPSRTLRSSPSTNLYVRRTNLHLGSRSFHIAAPTVWKSLSVLLFVRSKPW